MKTTRSSFRAVWASLMLVALLSGCLTRSAPLDCSSAEDFCIGLITQQGRIDQPGLNQMAWAALKKAESKLGVYVKYIETVDSRDYEKNIATFAKAGYDLIVTVGYEQSDITLAAAQKYEHILFIGVDQPLPPDKSLPDNLTGLSFDEDQIGFLAGVLATNLTRSRRVGAVCGPDSFDPAWRYCEGFKAGVGYVNSPPTPTLEPTDTPVPLRNATPGPSETLEPDVTPGDEPTLDEAPTFVDEPTEPLDEEPTNEDETPDEEETPDGSEETPDEFSGQLAPQQRALRAGQDELPSETPTPQIPVGETPAITSAASPTETPTVEAIVVYHNNLGFNESLDDPEWDYDTANALIDNNVDVVFGADSYSENGAISAAAKRHKFAIGVNIDQYFTVTDAQAMLVSSAMKQVDESLYNLIRMTKDGNFPGGNFRGTVGYAPPHDMITHLPASLRRKMEQLEKDMAAGLIETGVLWRKPEQTSATETPTEEPTTEPETPPDEQPDE